MRQFLRVALHEIRVVGVDLKCHGSVGISRNFMEEHDIRSGERIEVYVESNGNRFATYARPIADEGRVCKLWGPAARQAMIGDLVTITTWEFRDA